jgi:glycerophosphoryl diester phosphodiesterase
VTRRDRSLPADHGWLRDLPLAHRGLHGGGVRANSLAAFDAAAAAGVGAELDVRLAADGVPVVVHDPTVPGDRGPVPVESVSSHVHGEHGIPTLAAALAAMATHPVMVEVKNERRPGALEPAVARVLASHAAGDRAAPVCVASFNPLSLRWFRHNAPHVVRVLTYSPQAPDLAARERWVVRSLRTLTRVAPVALSCDLAGIDDRATQSWRAAGGTVLTWTVRTPADVRRARGQADNVIFEGLDALAAWRDGAGGT